MPLKDRIARLASRSVVILASASASSCSGARTPQSVVYSSICDVGKAAQKVPHHGIRAIARYANDFHHFENLRDSRCPDQRLSVTYSGDDNQIPGLKALIDAAYGRGPEDWKLKQEFLVDVSLEWRRDTNSAAGYWVITRVWKFRRVERDWAAEHRAAIRTNSL